jgi:hypothetical protein
MSTELAKVDLPLPASANAATAVSIWTTQSATIKQAPGYSAATAVQTVVVDLDTAVTALGASVLKVTEIHAQLTTAEGVRDNQLVTVRLKHQAVETALNSASNGDPAAAEAWTGKAKTRAKRVESNPSTSPPTNPALAVVKAHSGTVKASCAEEKGVVCYVFQQGTDPANPQNWPAPTMMKGHTFTVHNMPVGSTLCCRIAVMRKGSGQGQWSPVLQVTVR